MKRLSSLLALCLALAKEVAKLHGGDISAVSTPGQGSVFSLELPLPAAKPQAARAEASTPSRGRPEARFMGAPSAGAAWPSWRR